MGIRESIRQSFDHDSPAPPPPHDFGREAIERELVGLVVNLTEIVQAQDRKLDTLAGRLDAAERQLRHNAGKAGRA